MNMILASIALFFINLIVLGNHITASSDVNVTTFEAISKEDLNALPKMQCKSADMHKDRPVQSCIAENHPRGVFMFGYNETSCYLCYTNSSYPNIRLTDIKGVKWFARQGKKN